MLPPYGPIYTYLKDRSPRRNIFFEETVWTPEFHETSCPDRSLDSYHPKNGRELMDRGQRSGTSSKLWTINVAFNGQVMTSLNMPSSKSLQGISFGKDHEFYHILWWTIEILIWTHSTRIILEHCRCVKSNDVCINDEEFIWNSDTEYKEFSWFEKSLNL